MVGGTVPVLERFWNTRVAAAVIGPALPTDGISRLPKDIADQIPAGMGAIAIPGVPDQTDCSFVEDALSMGQIIGGGPTAGQPQVPAKPPYRAFTEENAPFARSFKWPTKRCAYHEEWQGSDFWLVLDKVVQLIEGGVHYLVYWSPGDQLLGQPDHTSKYGIVFGDYGQSESFTGAAADLGPCALSHAEFYEMDCHKRGHAPEFIMQIPAMFRPDTTMFEKNCEPFYGVPMPNLYSCSSTDAMEEHCNTLCPNKGDCSPAGSANVCDHQAGFDCPRSCAWLSCGGSAAHRGEVGPGCDTTTHQSNGVADQFMCPARSATSTSVMTAKGVPCEDILSMGFEKAYHAHHAGRRLLYGAPSWDVDPLEMARFTMQCHYAEHSDENSALAGLCAQCKGTFLAKPPDTVEPSPSPHQPSPSPHPEGMHSHGFINCNPRGCGTAACDGEGNVQWPCSFEWAGVFHLDAGTYTWTFHKSGTVYGADDASIKYVMIPVIGPLEENIIPPLDGRSPTENVYSKVQALFEKCQTPDTTLHTGECLEIVFDMNKDSTTNTISVPNEGFYGLFTEHAAGEFDAAFFTTADGSIIMPEISMQGGTMHAH